MINTCHITLYYDKDMSELLGHLTIDNDSKDKDDKRPDIAIIFSNDPKEAVKVDVVIVELKTWHWFGKRGGSKSISTKSANCFCIFLIKFSEFGFTVL